MSDNTVWLSPKRISILGYHKCRYFYYKYVNWIPQRILNNNRMCRNISTYVDYSIDAHKISHMKLSLRNKSSILYYLHWDIRGVILLTDSGFSQEILMLLVSSYKYNIIRRDNNIFICYRCIYGALSYIRQNIEDHSTSAHIMISDCNSCGFQIYDDDCRAIIEEDFIRVMCKQYSEARFVRDEQ